MRNLSANTMIDHIGWALVSKVLLCKETTASVIGLHLLYHNVAGVTHTTGFV